MTSLPKRGDRVRVTAVGDDPTVSLHPNHDVTLACNAHVHHEDWIHFDYVTVFGQKWSGPVKVEILERAGERDTFRLTCRKCGRSMQLVRKMLGASQDTTVDECALCDDERAAIHPEFARGMRRAAALFRPITEEYGVGMIADEAEAAIEKELK